MAQILQITGDNLTKIFNWADVRRAVQVAMLNVTERRAIQTPRSFTRIPNTRNILLTMPGYLFADELNALACKLVTSFPDNKNLPSILANILLFNENTGALEAILDGTIITLWRTAGASLVATEQIRGSNLKNEILALIGAGAEGRMHGIAFQQAFQFKKVHVWNRTYSKAVNFCNEENQKGYHYIPFKNIKECVLDADVIITSTSSTSPLIKYEWLKKGVHINAVGVCENIMELDEETYKSSIVYVDHFDGIQHELQHFVDLGIKFEAEIGELLNGTASPPASPNTTTIFQSLGMAALDCAVAKMFYQKYKEMEKASVSDKV